MDKLFRTAYYLVKNERPFTDFKDLLQLQKSNGLEIGETYITDKAANDYACIIADVYLMILKSYCTVQITLACSVMGPIIKLRQTKNYDKNS